MNATTLRRGDLAVERAANKLEAFVRDARAGSGLKAKLGDALADDPDFIRLLKPTLIAARAKGEAPTDQQPGSPLNAPSGPQFDRPNASRARRSGALSPWGVLGIAFVAGYVLAKTIDWRGHAHPRG